MSDILVVIPTYNEAENIRQIAAAVLAACPQAHILFVDDNSPDGTGRLADTLSQADPRVARLQAICDANIAEYGLAGGEEAEA